MMTDDIERVLLTEKQLAAKIEELGKKISDDYRDRDSDLLCISVLKGAVIFFSDLIREMDIHTQIDFMVVSSYGSGTSSSGVVKIVKDLDIPLEGRDVLIIEDILDSGKTLAYLKSILNSRGARSIKICTLLDKPARREADIHADYCGFEIPDEFVVGFGLDYAERYRNLPYIGILKSSVYS